MLDGIAGVIIEGLLEPVFEILGQIFGYGVGYVLVRGGSLGYVHVYPGELTERRPWLFREDGTWYMTTETITAIGLMVTLLPILLVLCFMAITRLMAT